MRPRKRLPISPVHMKKLAFDYERMLDASAACGIELAELIEQDKSLAAVWDRGQFLRRLYIIGREAFAPSQAAKLLDLSQEEFAKILKKDREARQLWDEARLQLRIKTKRAVLSSIRQGNLYAHEISKLLALQLEHGTEPSKLPEIGHVPLKVLADMAGVNRLTIRVWYQKGMPRNADGSFDLRVAIPWIVRWIENGRKLAGCTIRAGTEISMPALKTRAKA